MRQNCSCNSLASGSMTDTCAVPRQSVDQLDQPRHWNIYNSISTRQVKCPSSFCLALLNISLMVLPILPTCWNYV